MSIRVKLSGVPYSRMPRWMALYLRVIRRVSSVWVTYWGGVWVWPAQWDDGSWCRLGNKWIRAHESTHYWRIVTRPFISRLVWCVVYLVSKRVRLNEEVIAVRAELATFESGTARYVHAVWCAKSLYEDYGLQDITTEARVLDMLLS